MPRVFVPKEQLPFIIGSDAHYLKDVLRSKPGDLIDLLDGTGMIYRAKITKLEKDRISCEIISSQEAKSEPAVKITLAQALPKGHKMDFIVEKCTELGVSRIIPVLTERAVAKSAKLERWRKIAKEAAEQSGRAIIPEIYELTTFDDILKLSKDYALAIIPWEAEENISLKSTLTTYPPNHLSTILVLIGPEGGFSQKEVEKAKKAGFESVSLGKRILRAETAGMATLAMVLYAAD
jgi:16S rRNA (uracil1498-N3)-methyltransferase